MELIPSTPVQVKRWGKWFWIGLIVAFFMPFSGLIYGIAAWLEPAYRQEGRAITVFSILWWIVLFYVEWKLKILYPAPLPLLRPLR